MLFAMREVMQPPTSLAHSARIGAVFGIVVVAAVQLYDRALRDGQRRVLTDEFQACGKPQ